MWSEKYRPRSLDKMIGNEDARMALSSWLSRWKPGAKAALLVGPPGTGKTTAVTLLAKEAGMNLVELNASDTRTKEKLRNRIGEAMNAVSLFGEKSLIFLDEVDGLAGRSDYGAVEFIKDSIKHSKNPIVMAANNSDSDEVKKLSSASVMLPFRPPPPREVEVYLRGIAQEESIAVPDEDIRSYVVEAAGDVRQAINLLQSRAIPSHARAASSSGRAGTSQSYKDRSLSVSDSFNAFFDAANVEEATIALRKIPLQPIEKIRGIHRSVVKANLPAEKVAASLEAISRADLLMGRIMKTREWRMLRYLDRGLAEGLHSQLRGSRVRYAQDDLPFPVLLRLWNDSKKVQELSLKYAAKAHTSGMSARSQDIPFVFLLCSSSEFREDLERTLGLDETYDKFLQKESGRPARDR